MRYNNIITQNGELIHFTDKDNESIKIHHD